MNSKALLTVPDMVEAILPLTNKAITPQELFELIASGEISPFGHVVRAPVFLPAQIAEIADIVNAIYCKGQKKRKLADDLFKQHPPIVT